jgi:DNA-binding NtrC family response regulator
MSAARLLLVDDEPRFVETLGKRLAARGFDVAVATSGAEALERLQAAAVDVVVLDVRMPGMDGLQTLKEIRRLHPFVRVVLLSGAASVNAAIDGMRLGASDYLLKPVTLEDLLAKVQEAVERKRLEEARAAERA